MNKQQLEQLSDFEINIEMCKSLNIQHKEGLDVVFAAGKSTGDNVTAVMGVVDYCNNWSDMGPLLKPNNITIVYDNDCRPCAVVIGDLTDFIEWDFAIQCFHENELRAAAIVYLLMQDKDGE